MFRFIFYFGRYSDVAPDGSFTTSIKSNRARFLTVADQLLSGANATVFRVYNGELQSSRSAFELLVSNIHHLSDG